MNSFGRDKGNLFWNRHMSFDRSLYERVGAAILKQCPGMAAGNWNQEEPAVDKDRYPELYRVTRGLPEIIMALEGRAAKIEEERRIVAARQAADSHADKGTISPTMKLLAALGRGIEKHGLLFVAKADKVLVNRLATLGYFRAAMKIGLTRSSPALMRRVPQDRYEYLERTVDKAFWSVHGTYDPEKNRSRLKRLIKKHGITPEKTEAHMQVIREKARRLTSSD